MVARLCRPSDSSNNLTFLKFSKKTAEIVKGILMLFNYIYRLKSRFFYREKKGKQACSI